MGIIKRFMECISRLESGGDEIGPGDIGNRHTCSKHRQVLPQLGFRRGILLRGDTASEYICLRQKEKILRRDGAVKHPAKGFFSGSLGNQHVREHMKFHHIFHISAAFLFA